MRIRLIILIVLIIFCAGGLSHAQHRGKSAHNKNNRNFYKKRYSKTTKRADAQCFQLFKNKYKKRNKKVSVASNKKSRVKPQAEVDVNDTPPVARSTPKPTPAPQPIAKVEAKKDLAELDIEEKHVVEDEVLKVNHLPAPTSAKHEQIRKDVEGHLKNFDKEKPIKLEPLYFVTGQDEFAFVDMDPFLVAVEYALQGKIILIEGHTDHVGDFDANVALSIKRVEKIRELMVQMGVHDDQISVVGYGEEHSAASTAKEQKQNERRVDFTVF